MISESISKSSIEGNFREREEVEEKDREVRKVDKETNCKAKEASTNE